MRDALSIGRALADRDCDVSYAIGDPVSLVDFAGAWVPGDLLQAPLPRDALQRAAKRPPVDGFADAMATNGFDDSKGLMTLVDVWMRLIDSVKPDVIYAFGAPIVWMLGPSVARTVALGHGCCLPPILGDSFPRLSADSTPIASDETLLANANAALVRAGRAELGALSDVLGRCHQVLYGVPAFDPYLKLRRTGSAGLLGGAVAPSPVEGAPALAAFLDVACPGVETMVLALAGGVPGAAVDVFVHGGTTGMRRFLEQHPKATVWDEHAALLEHARHASAIIHHGEHDVAQRALLLGRPQLHVPWTREQKALNASTSRMGFQWTRTPNVSVDEFASTFRAIVKDGAPLAAAQRQARQLAKDALPDALPAILEAGGLAAA
ncbi:MAG: hypothetical protein KF889_18630 [Alphaproteobacteria bacterium]|nr:hypothetical protein [Alphaproteobacteria bacterium]MCW5743915.1 hypothetical protein [Alphaproteobacteria bacterium]